MQTDYFFHCAIEQVYFFSQNQSKEIFFQNIPVTPPPPPEYQMDRALWKVLSKDTNLLNTKGQYVRQNNRNQYLSLMSRQTDRQTEWYM